MADLEAYLQRLVDLAGDVPGIALADKKFPTTLVGHLPFLFMAEGTTTYQQPDRDRLRITQVYIGELYVQAFKDDNITEEIAARAAARPFLIAYPKFFWSRNRLQRSDTGLNGLVLATVPAADGIGSASRDQITYSGIRFQHLVTYEETLDRL